jgi:hypothetical protein
MFKVVVIICALGNPCTVFQQDPMKYYDTMDDCITVAAEKERALLDSMRNVGYIIEKNGHTCELKQDVNPA